MEKTEISHLPNFTQTPPGGWRFVVPETGNTIRANNFIELETKVKQHLESNDKPIPSDLADQIEAYLCNQAVGYCQKQGGSFMARSAYNLQNFIAGTQTIGSWILKGVPKVSQETAEKRAKVCVQCPKNQKPSGCKSCNINQLIKVVTQLTGNSKTSVDSQLHGCAACYCDMKVKVWAPIDLIHRYLPEATKEQLHPTCWILHEGQ